MDLLGNLQKASLAKKFHRIYYHFNRKEARGQEMCEFQDNLLNPTCLKNFAEDFDMASPNGGR